LIAAETIDRRRKNIQLMGRRSPQPLLLIAAAAFALLLIGCSRVSKPQGWAPPELVGDSLYVSIERGKMAALDANTAPETGADCDDAADNDGDGAINEGCPKAGAKSESGSDCRNDKSDDTSDGVRDDDAVNDGCPATIVRWIFPPDSKEGDKLDLEGIYGAPVIGDDIVYFGAHDGTIYALDAAEGFAIWAFQTDDAIVNALALKDGTLFAGSTDGQLYAIDAASGDETGRFDTGSSVWASPLVVGDVIYVAAMDGRLYALNTDTLDPVEGFSFKADAGLLMDPTLANEDTLLAGGLDSKLFALDPSTGNEVWPQPFEGGNWFWGRPIVRDDTIFIADLDGNVQAIGLDDGRPRWSKPFKAEAAVRSKPLLAGDTLVIIDRHGNAYGLNPEDGTQKWGPTLLGKTVLSDPFLLVPEASPSPTGTETAATEVLILAQGGDLCRIDPADGSPVAALLCSEVPS